MGKLYGLIVRGVRIFRNLLLDLRYGGFLGLNLGLHGINPLPDGKGPPSAEFSYSPYHWLACLSNSDVECLQRIFDHRIKASDVLVDVGCGRGRVINWWLDHGCHNQVFGIELDPATAERTRRRLRGHKNVTIITGDAAQNIPPQGTLFYLFNPFDAPTLAAFKDRLKETAADPKNVRIFYYTPTHIQVFQDDPAWNVQIETIEASRAAQFNPLAVITMK